MKYVSIDIETTGLKPHDCQVLQFAAIADDLEKDVPVEKLPKFERYILNPYDEYRGESYALAMNADLIKILAKAHQMKMQSSETLHVDGKECVFCTIDELPCAFENWLVQCGFQEDNEQIKITVAGKNVSGFDLPFLNTHIHDWGKIKFSHRTIDPGSMYLKPTDEVVPDSKECMKRAGLSGEVAHTALEDAMMVVKLIRNQMVFPCPDCGK